MNAPLRRVAVVAVLLFAALLVNIDYLQVFHATALRKNPNNGRQLLDRLRRERGAIVVAGQAIAESVPSTDTYRFQRTYPQGPLYAPLTGFYSITLGALAVEKAQDDVLSGADERFFVRQFSDYITGRTSKGGTVTLTIDPKAQQAAAAALGNRRGAAVALDPRTGAILALVTSPSYDPNQLAAHDTSAVQQAYTKLVTDPSGPLLDRATQRSYAPGSLFKVVTSAAALSTGNYTPDTVIPSPHTFTPPQTSVPITNFGGESCGDGTKSSLIDALRISCNTAFAQLGVTIGQTALAAQAAAFHIGSTLTGFPLPNSASTFPAELDPPALAQSAIGQRDVQLTPLQAAMIMSAVADQGHLLAPYLVSEVQGPDLSVVSRAAPVQLGQPITAAVASALTQMMTAVVANGTGTAAQLPGITVAGKTGTAQTSPGKPPNAWFGAFAPAQAPTVAVAVLVENGGDLGNDATGGAVAAPIARSIIQTVLADQTPPTP